ncbi:hypothetical protein [Fulvimarina sp. MAC3]|uniref:hypothetical protein n=1 Tax=Fulvimarina sp. MAC3 TaxID=3148887 RepID=UPI0031FDB42F
MTVTRSPDGTFAVVSGHKVIETGFITMAAAWPWIDRHDGDPINRSEDTSEWSWNKRVHGE